MAKHGLDSMFSDLTEEERLHLETVILVVAQEARANTHKRPKMTTLLEEMSELILSMRGKHKDLPELELSQVAAVAINLLWQCRAGNIQTFRSEE